MTYPQFTTIFARLAVQLRATDADEATMRGYFDALQDLEPEWVVLAAKRLSTTSTWFPKTSEWAALARKIEREREEDQRAQLRGLSSPLCTTCGDSGWAPQGPRVTRCGCVQQRYLERLGRRPTPALPPSSAEPPAADPHAFERLRAQIAPVIAAHTMPRARVPLVTAAFERAAQDDPILAAELARRRPRAPEAAS